MQTDELKKIKLKILALTQKTIENGCTEHEAMSAMAMVGRLLLQYNLNMSEIDVREQLCKTLNIPTNRSNRHPITFCMMSLGKLFNAKIWQSKSSVSGISYNFFGQENDLIMIEYLYKVILAAMNNESIRFKHSTVYINAFNRKGAYVSFQQGMAHRVSERLVEMKRDQDAEMENAAYTGSRALIVLKDQLVTEEFAKLNMRLKKSTVQARVRNGAAYASGRSAGDNVNLSRPVGQGNSTAYLK
jgi:hypothetical protein